MRHPPPRRARRRATPWTAGLVLAALACPGGPAWAAEDGPAEAAGASEPWTVHGQATLVEQANAGFRSPYEGPNSLRPAAQGRETVDATLYLGVRLWDGAQLWADAEVDQGFGLSKTLGLGGFSSGEAYRVGRSKAYPKLPRLFLRQTFDLGGPSQSVAPDLNEMGGATRRDRLVLTIGKFAVTDLFDANRYAHDPRGDFLNWAVVDAGPFDYAANAWGFTYGAAAELYRGRYAFRAGVFDLPRTPNDTKLDRGFKQFQLVAEAEARFNPGGRPGVLRLTGFLSEARMGRYSEALDLARRGGPADLAPVRRWGVRSGLSLDLEQTLADDVGLFVRAGAAEGRREPLAFADIDRSVSGGGALTGTRWGRPEDVVGLAAAVNQISRLHRAYLAAGGLGILVGDGRLPSAGPETVVESYYDLKLREPLHLTLDYQLVVNPAYNRDRGPVSIGAARLHAQF